MNLREHPNEDGMKVWLSEREVDQLLDAADDTDRRIAYGLAVRCGLRSAEILKVKPCHVADTEAGLVLRIPEGAKTGKYRETPIPPTLATTIRTVDDVRDAGSDERLLDVTTRTLRRWITDTRQTLAEQHETPQWLHLSMHDLRRTWATSLKSADVDPLLVCDWGGWEDLETFLEHYRGTFSPDAQHREREKVEWL